MLHFLSSGSSVSLRDDVETLAPDEDCPDEAHFPPDCLDELVPGFDGPDESYESIVLGLIVSNGSNMHGYKEDLKHSTCAAPDSVEYLPLSSRS
jgi:hypothetical protein